ncbi:MFS transporter [Novosphingobium nitrogenifigens]|nr:MFS transporter [Novosphingobium nitrogenifigens]
MLGITPAISATIGVLLVPIAQDFHWPRAQVSGVLGLISLISAVVYPWVGRAMDRLGARTMLILGNLVFAASVAALALSRPSVPIFYGLFALVGVAGAFPSTAMFCKAVADWFDERRGLMLGVTAGVGNGVGATVMPILAGVLLGTVGWRGAYLGIAVVVAGLGFPVLFAFLRDAPRGSGAHGDALMEGLTLGEAARTSRFWLLLLGAAAGGGAMTAVFTHVVPILTDRGVGLGEATGIVALFALVTAGWQVVAGLIIDRWRSPRIMTPMYALAIVGLLLLQFGEGGLSRFAAGTMLGIGMGAEYAALPYFISRFFGLRHFGTITGALYGVVILVQGLAPFLMDMSFDARGSYAMASGVTAVVLTGAMGLFAMLPRAEAQE